MFYYIILVATSVTTWIISMTVITISLYKVLTGNPLAFFLVLLMMFGIGISITIAEWADRYEYKTR